MGGGFGPKARDIIAARKREEEGNKIPAHLSGYLCEAELYTPENYDKVRDLYREFVDEYKDEWLYHIFKNNKKDFIVEFDKVLKHVGYDWVSARMIVHISITSFSTLGVNTFDRADDWMIYSLRSNPMLNR